MSVRCLLTFVLSGLALHAATFGRIVPLVGGATDIVLDESRGLIYLTSSIQNLVQIYSIQKQTFLTPIPTDQTPVSAAISRDGTSLYVTCYASAALDVINLNSLTVTTRVGLPAKPEGVAVGSDNRVLISTTGSGTSGAANVLLVYDPSPTATVVLASLSVIPAAPAAPTFPPPSGRPFLATHSQLIATPDGTLIAGVNAPATGNPTVFLYQAASDTVLRARIIAGASTALSISADGTRIMSGINLFDAGTLQVLAQENLANVPYPITPTATFNSQAVQGGSVFAPNGQTLYAAFNISPVQVPAASASVSQLMLSDPDNLLVETGIQLPENLDGKMIVSSDGTSVYAISDSGFTILSVGTINQNALAVPGTSAVVVTEDQCGVTAPTSSGTVTINNAGKGSVTATAQLLQYTGVTNQAAPATAPSVKTSGPQIVFSYNSAAAARGLGTITPPDDFLIQSSQAINIPNRVRVFENSRNSEARGSIIPIPGSGVSGESFTDIAYDSARQRIYIANLGFNRVEVYDIQQQSFLSPVKVGQLPHSLALTPDGSTLYVANSGGENISIVDPNKLESVGTVSFPPLTFNSNLAVLTPSVIAASVNGPMVLMSDGSLWEVVGTTLALRGVSQLLGATTQGAPVKLPVPSSMVATPEGQYILLATNTGLAYLYSASVDDWVAERQIFTTTTTGYIGPVAAGPNGQYFVVSGTLLNEALVPTGSSGAAAAPLVSAVAPVGKTSYAIFSPPAAASGANAVLSASTIQIVNATSGNSTLSVNALEGPITQVASTSRAAISGRTMAVDSAGVTAYVVTTSGLSIIPITAVASANEPQPNRGGAVNLASYVLPVAANGLLSIFGLNLGASDTANSIPLPLVLGGTCVTLDNVALPLFMTSPLQINAQIPPNLAPGTYPLVVRSITNQAASASQQLAVSKYGPAVLVGSTGQIALFHANGQYVDKNNPATRDEPLTMYAVGLGPTTGGTVTAGMPSPSSPLAVTGAVQVFFGDPNYSQSGVIVDWSGLAPGFAGLYQLDLRVPGVHMSGDALPVTIRVGSVNSPTTGPAVPYVAVN